MTEKLHPNNIGKHLIEHGYTPEIEAYLDRIKFQSDRLQRAVQNIVGEYDTFIDSDSSTIDYVDDSVSEEDAESITELTDSLQRHSLPTIQLKYVWVKGHKCYLECGWYDQNAHCYVVWDRIEVEQRKFIKQLIWTSVVDDNVGVEVLPTPKLKPPHPLFHYHPERYRNSRAFYDTAFEVLKSKVSLESGALTSEESINQVLGGIMEELNGRALSTPLRSRPEHPPHTILNSELTLLTNMAMYQLSGKQIMHINQHLTKLFAHTDVSDIPLATIKLPYSSQYVFFGKQDDIELEDGWYFDGAYIEKYPDDNALRITMTSVPDVKSEINTWAVRPEPIFHQRIENADSNIDLMTAITEAFSDKLKQFNSPSDLSKVELPLTVADVTHKNNVIRARTAERYFNHFTRAINLIGNACCYLTAHKDDREEKYPASAPEKLVAKTSSDKPKDVKRATSKLESLGYRKVSFYGFQHQASVTQNKTSKKQMHWRRGHWRRQPYGPKHSLRKLVWLMPTIIGGDKDVDTQELPGHIYVTDTTSPLTEKSLL